MNPVDVYESIERKVIDVKNSIVNLFSKKTCSSAACTIEPASNSIFCKYHKCLKCNNKRTRNNIYCLQHSNVY